MAKKRKRATKPKSQKSGNTTIVVSPAQQSKQSKGVRITKLLWRILYITVLCCLVVGLVSWGLQKIGTLFNWWNAETVTVDALEDGIATNANGGLTYDQIQQQLSDPDAPYCDDQFVDFKIVEYPSYVIIYREIELNGSYIYPNLLFSKTESGLVWDGVVGATAGISTNWWTGEHGWNSLSFNLQMNSYSEAHSCDRTLASIVNYVNIFGLSVIPSGTTTVMFSNFDWNFCEGFDAFNGISKIWYNWANETNTLRNYTRQYLVENVVSQYFSTFNGDTELLNGNYDEAIITTDANYLTKINSYYTFLYNQLKTEDHTNNSKLVDSTDYYARFITDYEDYPIPTDKLSEYAGETYYKVYKCKIIASCQYTYISENTTAYTPNVDQIDDYEIEEPAVVEEQAKLTVKLNNSDNSNLTGLSLADYPVTIIIDGRKFVYDDTTDLTNGKVIALDNGDTYTYSILSEALEFSGYSGSVAVLYTSQIMTLNYTYNGLYITVDFSLNPLNSMDVVGSLETCPVTITLTGTDNEGTYSTTWDSNMLTHNNLTMKRGTYVYVISSDYIVFNNSSGQIIINNNNKSHTFSCYIPEADTVQWSGSVEVWSSPGSIFTVDFQSSGINSIYDALEIDSLNDCFELIIKIFISDELYDSTSVSINYSNDNFTYVENRWFDASRYPTSQIQLSFYNAQNNKIIIPDIITVNNQYGNSNYTIIVN